jgi:hypothetical protein
MTPKQRSAYYRTCGYKETADCMDKMIAALEEIASRHTLYTDGGELDWLIDEAKEALK